MKKVFALLFVAGMITLASCESKKAEEAVDSTASVVGDSASSLLDSASSVLDTAAAAAAAVIDSVKK